MLMTYSAVASAGYLAAAWFSAVGLKDRQAIGAWGVRLIPLSKHQAKPDTGSFRVHFAMMVDVIIPTFNSAPWLGDAIESALNQTRPAPHQIIVVDDGSSDNTESVLVRYKDKIHLIRHETNRGLPAARNSGIRASTSALIAFLDADDAWTSDKLKRQIAEFAGDDPPGLSYTSLVDCDTQLQPYIGSASV